MILKEEKKKENGKMEKEQKKKEQRKRTEEENERKFKRKGERIQLKSNPLEFWRPRRRGWREKEGKEGTKESFFVVLETKKINPLPFLVTLRTSPGCHGAPRGLGNHVGTS